MVTPLPCCSCQSWNSTCRQLQTGVYYVPAALGADVGHLPNREAAALGLRALEDIMADLGFPRHFPGLDETVIDRMVVEASQQTRLLQNNPRQLGEEDIRSIYRRISSV